MLTTPRSLIIGVWVIQELYELAQRKFLRQLTTYVEHLEPYPRLFVADLNYDPNAETTEATDSQVRPPLTHR